MGNQGSSYNVYNEIQSRLINGRPSDNLENFVVGFDFSILDKKITDELSELVNKIKSAHYDDVNESFYPDSTYLEIINSKHIYYEIIDKDDDRKNVFVAGYWSENRKGTCCMARGGYVYYLKKLCVTHIAKSNIKLPDIFSDFEYYRSEYIDGIDKSVQDAEIYGFTEELPKEEKNPKNKLTDKNNSMDDNTHKPQPLGDITNCGMSAEDLNKLDDALFDCLIDLSDDIKMTKYEHVDKYFGMAYLKSFDKWYTKVTTFYHVKDTGNKMMILDVTGEDESTNLFIGGVWSKESSYNRCIILMGKVAIDFLKKMIVKMNPEIDHLPEMFDGISIEKDAPKTPLSDMLTNLMPQIKDMMTKLSTGEKFDLSDWVSTFSKVAEQAKEEKSDEIKNKKEESIFEDVLSEVNRPEPIVKEKSTKDEPKKETKEIASKIFSGQSKNETETDDTKEDSTSDIISKMMGMFSKAASGEKIEPSDIVGTFKSLMNNCADDDKKENVSKVTDIFSKIASGEKMNTSDVFSNIKDLIFNAGGLDVSSLINKTIGSSANVDDDKKAELKNKIQDILSKRGKIENADWLSLCKSLTECDTSSNDYTKNMIKDMITKCGKCDKPGSEDWISLIGKLESNKPKKEVDLKTDAPKCELTKIELKAGDYFTENTIIYTLDKVNMICRGEILKPVKGEKYYEITVPRYDEFDGWVAAAESLIKRGTKVHNYNEFSTGKTQDLFKDIARPFFLHRNPGQTNTDVLTDLLKQCATSSGQINLDDLLKQIPGSEDTVKSMTGFDLSDIASQFPLEEFWSMCTKKNMASLLRIIAAFLDPIPLKHLPISAYLSESLIDYKDDLMATEFDDFYASHTDYITNSFCPTYKLETRKYFPLWNHLSVVLHFTDSDYHPDLGMWIDCSHDGENRMMVVPL